MCVRACLTRIAWAKRERAPVVSIRSRFLASHNSSRCSHTDLIRSRQLATHYQISSRATASRAAMRLMLLVAPAATKHWTTPS